MKNIIVIPTYNERENIDRIIPAILAVDREHQVIVVDDDSPDGTGAIADALAAREPRIQVLHRPAKQGIGPAYKDGFLRALDLGADLIVQMDADFSHPPEVLPQFYAMMREYDLVVGSRYIDGITVVNWPMGRLMLSYFGNRYAQKVLGGLPIKDTTGGFKCWRRETLEAIDIAGVRSNGYAFQIEMNYRAWRLGFRINEVPIVFVDRRLGSSKMHLNIAVEALVVVWRLRLQNLLGRLEPKRVVAAPRRSTSIPS